MAAKTDEQKAAEQAEAQRLADEKKADEERAVADANLSNLADAEAKASAEAFNKNQIDEQAERREGAKPKSKEFGGQVVASDHFSISTRSDFGRGVIEVKPTGWVGDGFIVPAVRVAELRKLLGEVKNLPEQEKSGD